MRNGVRLARVAASHTVDTRLAAASRHGAASTPRRGFATGKDIRFGTDARALMLAGVDQLADAVQVTVYPCVLGGGGCLLKWCLPSSNMSRRAR